MTTTKRVRTLRLFAPDLYTWRNLMLSCYHNATGPKWGLYFGGKQGKQLLPCGASDLWFFSKWAAARYLAKHGYAVDGVPVAEEA